ncbi:glycosyltransferase [Pseudoalteromonas sp. Angola-30]|uniref:glycosyltransferase n=1 Tax=Pseudoalteromonas sp. Angola-30 TaxID=3025341 RepID=UPI002358A997|nr:glycosyltransferase [Pseudoalteromonas sp. Angola-30]MDC9524634.1 glycosyltransferase [Pseudoalteromonas sp. Angola-30]
MVYSFLINSLHGGGTEKVCLLLAEELTKNGDLVEIYIFDHRPTTPLDDTGVKYIYLGKKSTLSSFPSLIKLLSTFKSKSVLVFNHELAIMLFLAKKITFSRIKIISRMNNTFSQTIKFKKYSYRLVMKFLMACFYRYMDFYIFQSKGIKADLIDNFSVKGPSIQIPNPVNIPPKELSTVIKKSTKNLLYVGRLVKQKNVLDILLVFKEMSRFDNDLKLTVVGDGSERKSLESFCELHSLNNKVSFVGKVDDVSNYYRDASLTLLTSFNEGFPNVLLESIAAGTPVVSYDCPSGPSEIVQDNINGFLVNHLDKNHLKESIINALEFDWDESILRSSISIYESSNIVRIYKRVLLQIESNPS